MRVARVVGIALATVVAADIAAVAALAAGSAAPSVVAPVAAPVAAPAAAPAVAGDVQAVDVVAPTPITLVFATPTRAARPRVVAATRTRTTPTTVDSCGTPEQRGTAALAALRHPVPSGITIAYQGGRPDLLGLTYLSSRHIDLYVRSCGRESDALLRHVLAHELGHAYDASRMTPELRAQYLAVRGIPAGTPWMGCDRCADFATPAGDFAEMYSLWQRGGGDSRSRLGHRPTGAELAALGARFFSG